MNLIERLTIPSEILFVTGLALSSAILCGLFFVFSNFAMKSFSKLPPAAAIVTMQSINKTILNPGFLGLFLGTALGSLLALIIALKHWQNPASIWAIAGACFFLLGCLIVTATINVPLNDGLEETDPSSDEADHHWQKYQSSWQPWNHVRTISTFLSAACFIICALQMIAS